MSAHDAASGPPRLEHSRVQRLRRATASSSSVVVRAVQWQATELGDIAGGRAQLGQAGREGQTARRAAMTLLGPTAGPRFMVPTARFVVWNGDPDYEGA